MTVIEEQLTFLAANLPRAPSRVLDAGCGRGGLALALRGLGHRVTAVDIEPPDDADDSVIRADIAEFDDDPFDVVVFSLSLHHVADLTAVLTRARALLRPGGTLVVDEMAWERADKATATWFYDMAAALGVHPVVPDPAREWLRRHRDEHQMHTGAAMAEAVADHFTVAERTSRPYLYRYLSGFGAEHEVLEDIEHRRIDDGMLAAVGMRLIAR
ncbi:MAG: methyltransferase domain-containing protein [Catenulispora sp.]|nr:methyltransferase domain-containing protein [Catenulispora sp.]